MLRKLNLESRRAVPALAFTFALILPLVAEAGVGRTFVASNGQDANTATNCAVTAPCQTFAAAYGVTNVGGEIIAIDAAGYGPLTITNSVTIKAMHTAFIKPTPSTSGITISAGNVFLDNIEINGAGGASTTGITVNGGHLVLMNSALTLLTTGIQINGVKVDIINSNIIANTTGIATNGTGGDPFGLAGITWSYAGATTEARLFGGNVVGNTTAYFMSNPGASTQANTSDITILIYQTGTAVLTNTVGNGTLISGNGTGCPSGSTGNQCTSTGIYQPVTQNGGTFP